MGINVVNIYFRISLSRLVFNVNVSFGTVSSLDKNAYLRFLWSRCKGRLGELEDAWMIVINDCYLSMVCF